MPYFHFRGATSFIIPFSFCVLVVIAGGTIPPPPHPFLTKFYFPIDANPPFFLISLLYYMFLFFGMCVRISHPDIRLSRIMTVSDPFTQKMKHVSPMFCGLFFRVWESTGGFSQMAGGSNDSSKEFQFLGNEWGWGLSMDFFATLFDQNK